MEDKYISISEFAKILNISKQAVYKQVDKKLKDYVKLVDKRIMLNIQALKDVYGVEVDEVEQPIQPKVETVEQPVQQDNQLIIEILREELRKKDEEIKSMREEHQAEIEWYKEEIKTRNQDIRILNENLKHEQQLHYMSKQKILQLEESPKDVVEQSEQQPEKISFWSRLFKF